jgi:hypothetical protein
MQHWSEYEPYEIEQEFEVQCRECDKENSLEFAAYVWRDGSIFGSWVCPDCGEGNSSENLGNVTDFIDFDVREVN